MCFYASFPQVFGILDITWGHTPNQGEGEGYSRSPRPSECFPITFVYRNAINFLPNYHPSSPIQLFAESKEVNLGWRTTASIQRSQRKPGACQHSHSLWPAEGATTFMWYLMLWLLGCLISLFGRETDSLCKQIISFCWKQYAQLDISYCVWSQEIQPIPPGKKIHFPIRSQTTQTSLLWEMRHTNNSFSKNWSNGSYFSSLWLPNPGQEHANANVPTTLWISQTRKHPSTWWNDLFDGDE